MVETICVGRVVGAHGLRGGIRVAALVADVDLFTVGRELLMAPPTGPQRSVRIAWMQSHPRGVVLGLEAVTNRNAAEALVGAELLLDRQELPALESDTYYWIDLLGSAVVDLQGQAIGILTGIISTPGHDVFVVGEGPQERLFPAVAAVVQRIDLQARTIVIDPPDGL